MKPELDQWKPGEHNGTFRGNNLAFVTAKATLENYWQDDAFSKRVKIKGQLVRKRLDKLVQDDEKEIFSARGRGMMQALDCQTGELAHRIITTAFEKGLILETSGSDDQVLKCLMPLTISYKELNIFIKNPKI